MTERAGGSWTNWRLDQLGRPFETIWRITFKHDFPERADVTPMFVWGYQAQPNA